MIKELFISYDSEINKEAAINFAKKHNYKVGNSTDSTSSLSLCFTEDYIELKDNEKNTAIHIDFISGNLAHRQQYGGGRGQSIAKAIGLKQGQTPPFVIDATAGLAKDAFVLACLGCRVTLLERSPILVQLILDAINRAEENELFKPIIKRGFKIIQENSIEYLHQLKKSRDMNSPKAKYPDAIYPDIIYLDPMYPERKKSASVKKNMQLLQKLLGEDQDTQELLDVALQTALKRVVVKRPKNAPPLTKLKPHYNVESKKTRYDIYLIPD